MKRDTSVNLRITSELRAELQQLADADGRKLSGYIVRLLELHVQAQAASPEKASKGRK
jgi:predicted DNA binding CopG/RHH family protein